MFEHPQIANTTPVATTVAIVTGLALAACVAAETDDGRVPPSGGEPVVERDVRAGVTTVRNLSGSRWDSTATLVEELAIGEEVGEPAYLFGSITAAWATDDRIWAVDAQVPVVRAFDRRGEHLFDVGGQGQGPGEYGEPKAIAVTDDGRLAVADALGARINLYDATGAFLEDWPLQSQKSALGLVAGHDGRLYTRSWSPEQGRMGMEPVGDDGLTGEIRFPPSIEYDPPSVPVGKGLEMIVPFAPAPAWAYAPSGHMIAGVGDRYRFEIHAENGDTTVVERRWDPIPVESGEAAFRAHLATEAALRIVAGVRVSAGDLPEHKPAFSGFFADRAGRLWVERPGPGRPDPDCRRAASLRAPRLRMSSAPDYSLTGKPAPWAADDLEGGCWSDGVLFDVFEISSGELLGTIEPGPGFETLLFADEETVLATVSDASGTLRLVEYRLRLE